MTEATRQRRKIQLIAGVTYTVSLPKQWVIKNHLGHKKEIMLSEQNDGSLVLSPSMSTVASSFDSFEVNVDDYDEDITQIMFVLYSLDVENIVLFSKNAFSSEVRSRIKDVLRCMVGTEIVYEDSKKISIKVLLDKSKIDITQLFYRVSLLLNASITSLAPSFSLQEILRNEDEIDRLYHLIAKTIVLSQSNSQVLHSSKITSVYYLTSYLLIGKKLESIGDSITSLALLFEKKPSLIDETHALLAFIQERVTQGMGFLLNKGKKSFSKTDRKTVEEKISAAQEISHVGCSKHVLDALRFVEDIEQELTNVSFFTVLIREKKI